MGRTRQSAKRLAVPVSAEIAERVRRLAEKHGLPEAQIAQRWMAAMPEAWDPFVEAAPARPTTSPRDPGRAPRFKNR